MKIINLSKNTVIAKDVKIADNLLSRLKGLLGKPALNTQEALILKPCNSIHTCFMRFAIDAAFINRHNQIIKVYSSLKPWRISGIFFNAAFCIELPPGTLTITNTREGDNISIS